MISENVSFWFFCDMTVPWLFFKSKVIEFNAIITSRTKSRNPQQLKNVLVFLVLSFFNYLTKFVAPIRRNIIYLKYVQFLKTNSNKESAVLTFIDFAFFSAENLFFLLSIKLVEITHNTLHGKPSKLAFVILKCCSGELAHSTVA